MTGHLGRVLRVVATEIAATIAFASSVVFATVAARFASSSVRWHAAAVDSASAAIVNRVMDALRIARLLGKRNSDASAGK
jgi:hypothetical protein